MPTGTHAYPDSHDLCSASILAVLVITVAVIAVAVLVGRHIEYL